MFLIVIEIMLSFYEYSSLIWITGPIQILPMDKIFNATTIWIRYGFYFNVIWKKYADLFQ